MLLTGLDNSLDVLFSVATLSTPRPRHVAMETPDYYSSTHTYMGADHAAPYDAVLNILYADATITITTF